MTSTFPTFWSKLLIDCRIYFAMVTRIQYVYCNVDLMLVYYLLSNIEQQMTNQTHLLSERMHH
jgi:hypothetical protein